MAKRYRCGGITKKGERCKNLSTNGLGCYIHREHIEKKTVLETFGKAVSLTTGTASAIKLIYEILQFLIAHWPEINRFFHGLDTNSYLNYWQSYEKDCYRAWKIPTKITEQEAHDLVIEFNTWFPTLPRDVREMVIKKFSERKINSIKREGTS